VAEPRIAVVGAGPVGALAALELARHGMRPILLEARDSISWTSRAICISRRSLQILDRAGVGEALAAKALPWSKGKTFHRDRLVFRLDIPHASGDRHAPFVNLQQCYTEQFLIEAIEALGSDGADLRWGHNVAAVRETGTVVQLEVEGPEGSCQLDVDWLIAADGARSAVRSSLGLQLHGTSYEGRYLISDIEVEGADWPVERHVWFDAPANPGSTVILHVQPDGIWRVDCQLREGEDAEQALLDENLLPRLQSQLDMMGITAPWRLVWKSLYRAHSLSLDNYRHGRILFAGDAAHLVPIFGVRGLNSGLDDAHNLGWKLALVARGEAPEALLDSYSHERRRATAENIAYADRSTWFMSPPSFGFRTMRDAALLLAHSEEWASSLINPRQASFHVYADSPIVVADGQTGRGIRPGAPVPNLPLRQAEGLRGNEASHLQLALPPTGFALLIFADFLADGQVEAMEEACRALPAHPVVLSREDDIAEAFAAREFPLYLVRPDEHVAARLRTADTAALRDAFATAIGRRRDGTPEAAAGSPASPIEQIYEAMSLALDRADELGDRTFLARLALSLAVELGDEARALDLIEVVGAGGEEVSG
jgi:3-(3-hydroxy-phenyl)propionate hydroxylase